MRLGVNNRYVGYYRLGEPGGVQFMMCKRPSTVARLFSAWLLQWRWVDL